jgi:hypothetical protein
MKIFGYEITVKKIRSEKKDFKVKIMVSLNYNSNLTEILVKRYNSFGSNIINQYLGTGSTWNFKSKSVF